MKIVELNKTDLSQIRPLWEELNELHGKLSNHFQDHFQSFSFKARLRQIEEKESFSVFAAKDNSKCVGYCIASVENQVGEIDSIYIDPEHRSKKVGKSLINAAESWLNSKDISKIHVSVAEGNESVFGFYNKHRYYQRYTVLEKKA